MKRMILGVSVLLMLVQNGFSMSNEEYDKRISMQTTEVNKQIWRCNKAQNIRNSSTSDINICLESIKLQKENGRKEKDLAIDYLNTGVLYKNQGDILNAYKYYMKSAKQGGKAGKLSQQYLNQICKESPWACK